MDYINRSLELYTFDIYVLIIEMRFIGSKKLLLKNIEYVIINNIKNYKKLDTFCDIFSGTSIVGKYFKKYFKIISNDLLYFSYCIQNTNIKLNTEPKFSKLKVPDKDIINYLNLLKNKKKGFIFNNFSPTKSCERKYLTNFNAMKIDTLRSIIDEWQNKKTINNDEYFYLISLIIEATPFVSNIAGTYGAYLKNWDPRSHNKLQLVKPEIFNNNKKNHCFNENANNLIKKISGDILYLDPPYNNRQYLPNYHLLETIARYDNPVIRGKTGLRNYDNEKSNYCNKNFAENALEDLISNANFKYLIMSYNNEGIIDEKIIEILFKKYGDKKTYKKYEFPYRRYKRTKDNNVKKVNEIMFFIKRNG